ncbi:COG4223 family protein [Agrobacterium vitis]|uniref:COG4223 family protein n=1 Tax=Agrobacterium vitis TaxID=373 RepID=UPI003D2E2569
MVSGKPPRRSKTTEEPVTIDLTATPVQAPETVPSSSEEPISEKLVEDTGPASAPATELEVPAAAVKEDQSTAPAETVTSDPEPAKQEQAHFGGETSAFSPPPPDEPGPPPMDASSEEQAPGPTSRSSSPTTSSLVAAGIVGGLIALISASALQYAGVLPSAGSGSSKDDSAISQQVATLTADVERLKAGTANGSAPGDLSGLESRLTQLESGQQQNAVNPAAVSDLQAKLASANQAIDQLKSDLAGRVEKLTENQTEVSDKVSAIETKINKPRDDIEVARAIAASALKTAADRGGPFLAELRTLGSIAPEDTAIAALEPYATTGVTSRAELQRQFGPVADKILSTINAPAESANIGERLWASAMSVVKVRPVGNVEGDSASAIVARIEDKIRNGDLKGAAAEWDSLPEAGRTVSAEFKKALDARITVENQVSDALARAVAGRQG